ncbi:sulfatase-like hydrolase/transferase [Frigidibacter oleivorans]|uniref:sulfatase-like hydrolase/transferase n=1 Tax=Frigidibacter oleivorans TaxID=2487129 RepID=UPI0038B278F1
MARNILFIMCDQLRADYLSCYGHPHLHTPHIDALAARGVRFTQAYVQSTICGPSRMCTYTGRYMRSHGSTQNGVPLKVGEMTLGDHLRPLGARTVLVGKTHMVADGEGMDRLGIDPDSIIGVRVSECGFEPYERDDGLHPDGPYSPDPAYDTYLRDHGFDGPNPWEHWANSGEAPDGSLQNGWLWSHADKPARVPEEHSETPYMTRRAMQFMAEAKMDGRPWCLHLSYIKPHWPYIVPAPYHAAYGLDHVLPARRTEEERRDPHPILAAFQAERYSQVFNRPGARERVIPAYMGLIKQIDDQLGLLFDFMKRERLDRDTMVVFTSDHGDYLGDHWLGEKYLFHDASVRVPLIIADPSPAADGTRGTTCDALVEAIDLAPTFIEALGGKPASHILEGRSLLPVLHGDRPDTGRRHVISEYDYSFDLARVKLEVPVPEARLYMVFDGRYKYLHADGFAPMLYDLATDPDEFNDLGADPAHQADRERLYEVLAKWSRTTRTQTTVSDEAITRSDARALAYDLNLEGGVLIGYWDEQDLKNECQAREAFLSSPGG